MYADEGQYGSTKPVYQVLMDWKKKPGAAGNLQAVSPELVRAGLSEIVQWEDGAQGGRLYETVDLGRNLDGSCLSG